jgi:hypothetical protein
LKINYLLLFALCFSSASNAENLTSIEQVGGNNSVLIKQQNGDSNTITVTQDGLNNIAGDDGIDAPSPAPQITPAHPEFADVIQQNGSNNGLVIEQTGDYAEAYVIQNGNADAHITQDSGAALRLEQQVDNVSADITQGAGQVLNVTQSTPYASVTINQPDSGVATVTPSGAAVTITPTPADAGIAITVTQ